MISQLQRLQPAVPPSFWIGLWNGMYVGYNIGVVHVSIKKKGTRCLIFEKDLNGFHQSVFGRVGKRVHLARYN